MKILNLYAGIGGNRKLWGDEHEITAVEFDQATANIYNDFFPNDTIIVADAHKYLLNNFKKFDFIWSSPPCPTHSILNRTINGLGIKPKYPDMKLYEEIILLEKWFQGLFVVENVVPYYEPLIKAKKIDRHLWWANFNLRSFEVKNNLGIPFNKIKDSIELLERFHNVNLSRFNPKGKNSKIKMLRNMVHPETGLHILNCALKKYELKNNNQTSLFI